MNNEIVPSMNETVFNSNIKDLLWDISEIGIDSIIKDGLFSELPIVKTVIAVCKTGLNIQERNFLNQTISFVKGFNSGNIPEEKLNKYKEEYFNNPKRADKELGRITVILNHQVENMQSEVLGRLYSSYIKGAITWEKFCEFAEANRRMFAEDYQVLNKLMDKELSIHGFAKDDEYKVSRLIGLGMVVQSIATTEDIDALFGDLYRQNQNNTDNDLGYHVTKFGKGFWQHSRISRENSN